MADRQYLQVQVDNSGMAAKEIRRAIRLALETIGQRAEDHAKEKCPVGTPESTGIPGYMGGTLRGSITHAVQGDSAYVGTNVEYAPYVEMGTRYMAARPFLRPAATEHGDEYRAIIRMYFKNG